MESTSRRRILAGTALGGVGLLLGLRRAKRASALSLEAPDVEAASLYANRCSIDSTHQQLVADILARLDGRGTPAEIEAVLSSTTCPFCGCRLG